MKYIVAGVTALLTVLAGILAYAAVCAIRRREPSEELNRLADEEKSGERTAPVTVFFKTAKGLLPRQWILIGLCAVINSLAAVKLVHFHADTFVYIRLLTALVFLFSAFVIDRNTKLIPNAIVLMMLGAGALVYGVQLIVNLQAFQAAIISAAIGLFGNLLLFYVMSRLTRDGIGMGDVKLIAALGWLTGFETVLISVLISMILCSGAAVVLIFGKRKKANDSVPFGPFVYFGYVIALIICNF